MRIKSISTFLLIVVCTSFARVYDFYLRDMVDIADVIILAETKSLDTCSKNVIASAIVKQYIKGKSKDTICFQANPTWACDITDAKKNETAVYFLTRPYKKAKFRKIVISGRGRIPLIFSGQDTIVRFQISAIYPWDLVKKTKVETLQTNHKFTYKVRSVPYQIFISKIKEQISTKPEIMPTNYLPPPDYDIYRFVEKNKVKDDINLETLFDGIPRIGNDKKVLEYLFGTIKINDANSNNFKKRMKKLFPNYQYLIQNEKLMKFERIKK